MAPPSPAVVPGVAEAVRPMPASPSPVPSPQAYPAPAVQVAPAIVSLAAAARPGQPERLTIRLDPGALGAVEIRVERSAHGPTHIALAVERPDTLLTLMADRPALHAALDLAGVPPEGRTVQFSLTPPDPGPGSSTQGGSSPGGTGMGTGFGAGGGGSGGTPGGSGRGGEAPPPPPRRTRLRTGIDITA